MRINSALTTAASSLAIGVAALSAPAFAQSTGSIDFEKEIIVTGTRSGTQEVAGISAPDTAKAKAVLTQENIERQNPGQTILDTINQIQSHLLAHQYEGLIEKSQLRGKKRTTARKSPALK